MLSKSSYLRSQKNLAIAGITLATRAAMEGGLHSEVAYTMSDLYIQHLEELKDIQSVVKHRTEAMHAFAERVRQNRAGRYSNKIMACQTYIFNHIYEEISAAELAEKVGLNANYLSQLFKKEVGMPIHAYIVREKIEEAKKLLSDPALTLSEICAWLNFYDQSHFTKIFRKLTGVTPKQFRLYPNG
ncbi:helix-turn-helix domain-containing protein [Paenibacillus alkaliterrae]|uniref:helix-turn-helix domain-containing protein n=1 Tax=Paenibacillus alkaliterrae TaxID=320909 RepID=UPI001F1C38D9|nr:helix-turn-helix domain-containing protein [Paenibacillus alkaliterrae]MCF2940338.1 helix-turn-helix domain-containing protein [Paenibacillus alkaliterrae]